MMMVFGMKGNRRQTDFRFYKISRDSIQKFQPQRDQRSQRKCRR